MASWWLMYYRIIIHLYIQLFVGFCSDSVVNFKHPHLHKCEQPPQKVSWKLSYAPLHYHFPLHIVLGCLSHFSTKTLHEFQAHIKNGNIIHNTEWKNCREEGKFIAAREVESVKINKNIKTRTGEKKSYRAAHMNAFLSTQRSDLCERMRR